MINLSTPSIRLMMPNGDKLEMSADKFKILHAGI